MWNWIRILYKRMVGGAGLLLRLESQVQSLKLDIAERDKTINELKADTARLREAQKSSVAASVDTALERFMVDVALPMCQLATQIHLHESAGKQVNPKDMFSVGKRLCKVVESAGLAFDSEIGTVMHYDSDRHEPMGGESVQGGKVRVLMPGAVFRGKVVRKAAVEIAGE